MRLAEVERILVERLAEPLPGHAAQARMAPRPRTGWSPGAVPLDCRSGVVLLLLYPVAEMAYLVLTLRPSGMARHAAEVSLPGGAVEEGETLDAAALREAQEEIGIDPVDIVVFGGLTPLHVPVSGFVLHPRIGIARSRPEFAADSTEVERILEVPVGSLSLSLAEPELYGVEQRGVGEGLVEIPFFKLGEERVWGATAMVLAEFLAVLGRLPEL